MNARVHSTTADVLPGGLHDWRDDAAFRVLDPGGKTITVASFVYDAGRLCFRETRSTRGRLTDYFFLDCRREVRLELDSLTLRGTLTTFWNGRERLWRLRPAA